MLRCTSRSAGLLGTFLQVRLQGTFDKDISKIKINYCDYIRRFIEPNIYT